MKLLLFDLNCLDWSVFGDNQSQVQNQGDWVFLPNKIPSNLNRSKCIVSPADTPFDSPKSSIFNNCNDCIGYSIIRGPTKPMPQPVNICYLKNDIFNSQLSFVPIDEVEQGGTYIYKNAVYLYFNQNPTKTSSSSGKTIYSGQPNLQLTTFNGTLNMNDLIIKPSLLIDKLAINKNTYNSDYSCFSLISNVSVADLQILELQPDKIVSNILVKNTLPLYIKEFKDKFSSLNNNLSIINLYKIYNSGGIIENSFILFKFNDAYNLNCCKPDFGQDFCENPYKYNINTTSECASVFNTYCGTEIKDPFCGCYQPYIQHNIVDSNPDLKAYLKGVGLSASCASSCSPPAFIPNDLPQCNLSICSTDIGNTDGIKGIYVNQNCGNNGDNGGGNNGDNGGGNNGDNGGGNNGKNKWLLPVIISSIIIFFIFIFLLLIIFLRN
jgi:hypothetical protein